MVTQCPVRSLTRDVRYAMSVFDRCYVRHSNDTAVGFERVVLPGPGTILDQDAWLMDCLGLINTHLSAALSEQKRSKARASK